MIAGANIGGGEWLFGPVRRAQQGGRIMWPATLSVLLQVADNLAVTRRALYCGEPIFRRFFRAAPSPLFGTVFNFFLDMGSFWFMPGLERLHPAGYVAAGAAARGGR